MRKKICCLSTLLIFFTCLCSSCKSPGYMLPPSERMEVQFEDSYNVNEDVTVKISAGFDKEDQEMYCKNEDEKFELGCVPNSKKRDRSKAIIFYTFTDILNEKYYYTKKNKEIIYHFNEQFVIPKEFFSETNFFRDSYGEFLVFLGVPYPDGSDWGSILYTTYVYEKQGESLVIQTERTYRPKNYSLKVDLEESYNVNEDVTLTISIGIHQRFQEVYVQKEYYKMGSAYALKEYNDSSKDQIILYTITDFWDDRYFYSIENNEIIYHFSEQFKIDKGIFNNSSGEFCIYLWSANSNGPYGFLGRESTIYYTYKKQGDSLLVSYNYTR